MCRCAPEGDRSRRVWFAGSDGPRDATEVTRRADGAFDVQVVGEGGTATRHVVTVPAGMPAALGLDGLDIADLVRASFAFLLEHEPATSILRSFSLDVIGSYFPEYTREMTERLGRTGGEGSAPTDPAR